MGIHARELERLEGVGGILPPRAGAGTSAGLLHGSIARVVRLPLVDVGCLRGEPMWIGDVLILRVDGDVAITVGSGRCVEIAEDSGSRRFER